MHHFAKGALAPLALLLVSAALATPEAIDVTRGEIVEVTVYDRTADVVRERVVSVTPGPLRLRFSDLPESAKQRSLQVTVDGVPVRLIGVAIETAVHEARRNPACQESARELERLDEEKTRLDAVKRRDDAHRAKLHTLMRPNARAPKEGEPIQSLDALSISEVYGFVEERLRKLDDAVLARKVAVRELGERRRVAKARCPSGLDGRTETRDAVVELDVQGSGRLAVRLGYNVDSAWWFPAFAARLDEESGEVELRYEGVVRQLTDEDWTRVGLKASTAEPTEEAAPRLLTPPLLRVHDPRPVRRREPVEEVQVFERSDVGGANFHLEADTRSLPVVARSEGRLATSMVVPGVTSVSGDGSEHRVVLQSATLPSELLYQASPSASENVYVVARVTLPASMTLPAGTARLSIGDALIGQTDLAATAPGEDLFIPFGREPGVSVKRHSVPREKGQVERTRREQRRHYAFKTVFENHRNEAVVVAVTEALPISLDEEVEVMLDQRTTPGHEEISDRPGILKWKLELAPGEKKELFFGYEVRHPNDTHLEEN